MKSEAPVRNADQTSLARSPSGSRLGSLFFRPSVWIAMGLFIIAGVFVAMRASGPIVSTILASKTDLEQHVIASGRVWVVTRVQISPQISGRVVSVRVVEGQRVRAGDLLVQFDDAEAKAAVSQANAAVSQSDARVEQLRSVGAIVTTEASRQAQTNLDQAQVNLARMEKLFASGDVPRVNLEEAQHSVEIARSLKNAAEVQKTASTPAGADSRIAVSALSQNQAQLSAALLRLQQSRIVAPQDGIILSRMVEPGYTVQPGTTLIEMAAQGETQLAIEPDERNLAWIRVGQKALAAADTYPRQTFEA
jgi:HlyD family secretion protein